VNRRPELSDFSKVEIQLISKYGIEGERKMKRVFDVVMLLTWLPALALSIQPASADVTIHIRADGSVDPPTALISNIDNVS
jgi:hypothetical protein